MKVLVVGAYGLIGGYVTARLLRDGCQVIGAGRDIAAAGRRLPRVRWVRADLADFRAEDWAEHLRGVDAVVNCAGALQDSPRDDLAAVHVRGPLALAEACVMVGVRRFVQISAAGVDAGPGAFSATKAQADAALRALDLDWVILRPGLVLAPAPFGGTALLRGLAGFPGLIPAVHADAVVQVVGVEDVAEAVARAIRPELPARFTADLAAAGPTRLGDVLLGLRGWLGFRPARLLGLPPALSRLTAWVADGLAMLGWRSPMRSTAVAQLAAGVRGRAEDAPERLGFTPRGLNDILAGTPSGVQDRWFARLYFVKPLMLATLAVFWMVSGLIGLLRPSAAVEVLTSAGFEANAARAWVLGGAVVDIALGALACARATAAPALLGMVAVSAAYLLGATLWRPDLWLDPLGPLVKVVPSAVLALCALAVLDER